MKEQLLPIFIVVMPIILAVEIKYLYDIRHQPTPPPADMVYRADIEYGVQNPYRGGL